MMCVAGLIGSSCGFLELTREGVSETNPRRDCLTNSQLGVFLRVIVEPLSATAPAANPCAGMVRLRAERAVLRMKTSPHNPPKSREPDDALIVQPR